MWAPRSEPCSACANTKQFQTLPRDEFPSLVALAGALTDDDADAVFQLGIDVLLRGIEARARASSVG